MKKLFLIASLLTAISCTHQNQKVTFDLSFKSEPSNIGRGVGIDVAVFDDRTDKEFLGRKRFGDEKIVITSDQDLVALLQKKIGSNLLQKGFSKGKDKLVEIRIETLDYAAKRNFFIGTSNGKASFKVIVTDTKTKEKFSKNFALAVNGKHFIVPLESTDSNILNALVQEIVDDILKDESFLKSLSQ
ncbi:MAG: YajG family lipoprotein [Pseudomonadota bacterium]